MVAVLLAATHPAWACVLIVVVLGVVAWLVVSSGDDPVAEHRTKERDEYKRRRAAALAFDPLSQAVVRLRESYERRERAQRERDGRLGVGVVDVSAGIDCGPVEHDAGVLWGWGGRFAWQDVHGLFTVAIPTRAERLDAAL